jgi:hypothetical protein
LNGLVAAETPVETEKPIETEKPAETEEPVETENPTPTDTPANAGNQTAGNNGSVSNGPKTGDTNGASIVLYALLFMGCSAALAGVVISTRKIKGKR